MKKVLSIFSIVLLATATWGQSEQTQQMFNSCNQISYLLSFPKGYQDTGKPSPLLLFLHGSGERGNDLNKVKAWGPPKLLEEGKQLPFIVVSPQCPENQGWDVYVLKQLLDFLIQNYNVDESRIYLTGLSMGGFGTWKMASAFPEYFAAIVPICGGGDPLSAYKIKNIPCQVFHGEKDMSVPLQRSTEMVEALKKLNADVEYTIIPEGDHGSAWMYAYNKANLWDWFLKHKKEDKHVQ